MEKVPYPFRLRAWVHEPDDIQEGFMVYDVTLYGDEINMEGDVLPYPDDSIELMIAFTQRDINHELIYEGDIVRWKPPILHTEYGYGVVQFKDDKEIVWLYIEPIKQPRVLWDGEDEWREYEFYGYEGYPQWEWYEVEVIGNIYENPDLLEELRNGTQEPQS